MLGQPSYFGVVLQHRIAEGGRADEPTFARVLDQRVLACPPAERVVVNILLLMP